MSRHGWEADPRRWGFYDDEEDESPPVTRRVAAIAADEAPKAFAPASAATARAGEGWRDDGVRRLPVGGTDDQEELYDDAPKRGPELEGHDAQPVEEVLPSGQDAVRAAAEAAADLMDQSRTYPGVAWAVGVFEGPGGARLYATSNEGPGFLPPGLRWDTRLRHVFGPAVPGDERGLCLFLEDPSRTVLDHYFLLRSLRPGLRLAAIASTRQPGAEVSVALRSLGAFAVPPAQAETTDSPRAQTRLHAVAGGSFDRLISSIPARGLWAAGLDLAADLAREVELHKSDAELAAALDRLRKGAATEAMLQHAQRCYWRFSAQAQARRVPDSRLGPVDLGSTGTTFERAMELSAAIDYCPLFFAARASSMLHVLIQARLRDQPLGEEQLAELAYEHASVAEDLQPARTILQKHGGADEDGP